MAVDAGPDGRAVGTGGSIRVDAVARSKQDGGVVEPTKLVAATCSSLGETVCPAQAPNPGSITFSDPGRRWKPTGPAPCLVVTSVSRRGIGSTGVTFKVRGQPIPLFTVKVDYTVVNDCGPSPSVTLDDATFTGALSKRDPDSERLSVGTGLANGTSDQLGLHERHDVHAHQPADGVLCAVHDGRLGEHRGELPHTERVALVESRADRARPERGLHPQEHAPERVVAMRAA